MTKDKVYISIPISGRDIEKVKKEISEVSKVISSKGLEPVSPLEGLTDYTLPWIDYILRDLKTLSECQAICKVTGLGKTSYGMQIEMLAAYKMGLRNMEYDIIEHKLI